MYHIIFRVARRRNLEEAWVPGDVWGRRQGVETAWGEPRRTLGCRSTPWGTTVPCVPIWLSAARAVGAAAGVALGHVEFVRARTVWQGAVAAAVSVVAGGTVIAGSEPVLCLQQNDRGEHDSVLGAEHAAAIRPLEHDRCGSELGWGQPQRRPFGCVDDQPHYGLTVDGRGEPQPGDLAGGFGVQVPASPRRALLPHRLDHRAPDLRDRVERQVLGRQQRPLVAGRQEVGRPCGRLGPQHLGCALAPLAGQLRQRGQGLGRSGGKGRLGAQLEDGRGRRTPAVLGAVAVDEPVGLGLDRMRPAEERLDQPLGDTGDLPCGVAVAAPVACIPADPNARVSWSASSPLSCSDSATVAACIGRPSSDRHRPS